jgi:Domain of unknown function (DUF4398)
MTYRQIVAALTFALSLGCASYPRPIEAATASEASIRAAQEVGAQQVPSAALQFQLAKEELANAQALMKDNENEKADSMLIRSRADAELAIALTKEAKAQADEQAAAQQLKDRMSKTQ